MGKTNKEKGRAPNERKPKKEKTPNINHEPKTQWTDEEREVALSAYIISGNAYRTARRLGIPESTLRTWIKDAEKENDEIAKLREAQRERACVRAWDIVDLELETLLKRAYMVADMGERVIEIIKLITTKENKLSTPEREKLLKELASISLPDERSIAQTFATVYDKAEHLRTGIDPSAAKFDVNISVLEETTPQSPAGDSSPDKGSQRGEDTSSTASGPPSGIPQSAFADSPLA